MGFSGNFADELDPPGTREASNDSLEVSTMTTEPHDQDEIPVTTEETSCVVVGGGPGGMVLALLLAHRRIPVTLLEAHTTFAREFRGDTIHTSILELLDELGLVDRLLQRPHVKMYGPTLPTEAGPVLVFDFRELLTTKFPFILWIPQYDFLEFLAEEAARLPSFRLVMGANVQRLVETEGVVRGVRYRTTAGWHEIRAQLTVGADGRFSRVRKLAGLRARPTSAPVELLWFRLPRMAGDPEGTGVISPRFGRRRLLLLIDRADHWQVGCFFPAGQYAALRGAGVEGMRRTILDLEPRFAENVKSLTDWQQFSLLSVASSCCRRWYRPGLLLIGDAAHTMTPAAGSGIKYAIEDSVVAANVLTKPLREGKVRIGALAEVQRRRIWPTRIIQAFGAIALGQLARALKSGRTPKLPKVVLGLCRLPLVARVLARLLAIGLWRVRWEPLEATTP